MKSLTREEAIQRLENPKNLVHVLHKNDFSKKSNGNHEHIKYTPEEKSMISILASELGNQETGRIVGCDPDNIPAMRRGITSHNTQTNAPSTRQDLTVLEKNQEKISERSIEKVLKSLDLIEDDKLQACNAVELATIAQKLSGLSSNKNGPGTKVNVNIYTAPVRTEDQFETIVG